MNELPKLIFCKLNIRHQFQLSNITHSLLYILLIKKLKLFNTIRLWLAPCLTGGSSAQSVQSTRI